MKLEKHHYFYFFVVFLFLGITAVNLFSEGMFMDGLYYAAISRNMAEGLGSFWKPHLSYGIFDQFYEHPPLALGLQSLWFRIFGDSIYVERLYSLTTFIIVGYLIVLIWAKYTNDKKSGWIPLLFWITINGISWSAANNLLENSMSIFVCLSVLLYLIYSEKKRIQWLVFAGISLSLGLLTKGFTCLYIWGFPFFIWLFKREKKFSIMFFESLTLFLSTILPIVLLYFFIPDAQANMNNYINNQVLASIESVKTVDTRFAILGMFFEGIIVPVVLGSIIIIIAIRHKIEKSLLKVNTKEVFILISVVFSGILPIMISLKQRSFYILTVYPLFSIAIALYLYPVLNQWVKKVNSAAKGFRVFKIITLFVVTASLLLSVIQINRVGRDKILISDTKKVISIVGKNESINICPTMFSDWSLHGYFSRYGNVSLIQDQTKICQYYLADEGCNEDDLNKKYKLIPCNTQKYKLYKFIE